MKNGLVTILSVKGGGLLNPIMLERELQHNFSVINVDHVKLDSKWNYNNVVSPYNRLYYIDEGVGLISDSENNLTLEPGFMYLIPHYTLCNLVCFNYLSQFYVHFFENSTKGNTVIPVNSAVLKIPASDLDILYCKRMIEVNPNRGINRSDDPKVYEKDIYYKEYQLLNENQSLSGFLETQGLLLLLCINL